MLLHIHTHQSPELLFTKAGTYLLLLVITALALSILAHIDSPHQLKLPATPTVSLFALSIHITQFTPC
ncbi:hypothetical protein BDU57DRAFT_511003 [Ampelomyces quisqualis]|uniref:Uncharacterized protein n=1 Tax=Ampelomyces quisqualis TaxID=50730 RepID=A0A6A5R2M0_AMPQU|nr:hypothetical protein BDU57DRAFT_511003 [Ampelomyces quisqualis]